MVLIETLDYMSVYAPSQVIKGHVVLKTKIKIKKIDLQLRWYTEGKDYQYTEHLIETKQISQISEKNAFEFKIPLTARLSFDGPLFKIGWKIIAIIDKYVETFEFLVLSGKLKVEDPDLHFFALPNNLILKAYPRWRFWMPMMYLHYQFQHDIIVIFFQYLRKNYNITLIGLQFAKDKKGKWQQEVIQTFPIRIPALKGAYQWHWVDEWPKSLNTKIHVIKWYLQIETNHPFLIKLNI